MSSALRRCSGGELDLLGFGAGGLEELRKRPAWWDKFTILGCQEIALGSSPLGVLLPVSQLRRFHGCPAADFHSSLVHPPRRRRNARRLSRCRPCLGRPCLGRPFGTRRARSPLRFLFLRPCLKRHRNTAVLTQTLLKLRRPSSSTRPKAPSPPNPLNRSLLIRMPTTERDHGVLGRDAPACIARPVVGQLRPRRCGVVESVAAHLPPRRRASRLRPPGYPPPRPT